jgi:hypothetical protein
MSVDTPAAASQFAELQSRIVNPLLLTMRVDAPAPQRLQFCLPAQTLGQAGVSCDAGFGDGVSRPCS